MVKGELVAAMVVQEEAAKSASPFATAVNPKMSVYYINEGVLCKGVPEMMKRPSSVSQETVNSELENLTAGIPPAKAKAIADSVASSFGVVDTENTFEYEPTPEDITDLQNIYTAMLTQLEEMKSGGGSVNNKLDKYLFKKHLLIQGQKGFGKTYMVSKMLIDNKEDYDTVDMRGHEGVEAIDLLGHYIRDEEGGLVWKDGVLTQAFRNAAKGKKTVLFIDEMLRIPKRELNILVGALSPDSEGNFSLDTNRASAVNMEDGVAIAESEKLVVKKDMLWAIGTTNAGAGYAVDTIDEALADRFRVIIKRMSESEMQEILYNTAKEKGMGKPEVARLMKFYKGFNALRDSGELVKLLNLRHLSEVIEFSDDASDMPEIMTDLIPTLCSQDQNGFANETQESIIEGLIEKELVA